MPKKTKILFILESYFPNVGGVENLFKLLAESLVEQGFEVEVLTAKTNNSPAKENINGVEITRIPFKSRFVFTFLAWMWGFGKASNTDIIHTTSYNAAIPAYILGKLFHKKTIITFHEYWGDLWYELPFLNNFQRFLYSKFEKFIANLNFDKFVAVSDYTKQSLIKAGVVEEKISRIYNGIDYSIYNYQLSIKNNKEFTFLFSGRAGVSKGLNVLADAIYNLQLAIKNFKVIIHSSDDRQFGVLKQIEEKVNETGILDKVVFDRSRYCDEDWIKLVCNANCVIIPSYSEGFSFAAAEVCALGVPVIHSGKGALKEVVSGKYLVFEDMSAEDLAEKMLLAIQGKFESKELKKFELQDSVAKYISLYSKL